MPKQLRYRRRELNSAHRSQDFLPTVSQCSGRKIPRAGFAAAQDDKSTKHP